MNKVLKERLFKLMSEEWNESSASTYSDGEIYEFLIDTCHRIKTSDLGESRWWNNYQYIVKTPNDNAYFRYDGAETIGNRTARECGFEFNMDSIKEVKIKIVMVPSIVAEDVEY